MDADGLGLSDIPCVKTTVLIFMGAIIDEWKSLQRIALFQPILWLASRKGKLLALKRAVGYQLCLNSFSRASALLC